MTLPFELPIGDALSLRLFILILSLTVKLPNLRLSDQVNGEIGRLELIDITQ